MFAGKYAGAQARNARMAAARAGRESHDNLRAGIGSVSPWIGHDALEDGRSPGSRRHGPHQRPERVRLAFPKFFAPDCVTAIDGHHEEVDDS